MESPIFDLEIEALLEAKINYHKEQIKFHAKMAAQTKEKLKLLSGNEQSAADNNNLSVIPKNNSVLEMPQTQSFSSSFNVEEFSSVHNKLKSTLPSLNEIFSVTHWKPLVEDVLKKSTRPLKTHEILREIDSRYLIDESLRKKAIAVISSSLFALVKNKKVNKMENEGNRGNLYELIRA